MDINDTIGDFLVKLRMDDYFDDKLYDMIYNYFSENIPYYKKENSFPADMLPSLLFLVDQLAGGSRFWDYDTCIKAEDAEIKLQELFADL